MTKKSSINRQKITLDWLLSFERLAGMPVVVSLAVRGGQIEFLSAEKDKDHPEGGDDLASISLRKKLASVSVTELDMVNYIG